MTVIPNPFDRVGRVALLVDSENISHRLAEETVRCAARFGELFIKRVYGNAGATGGWEKKEQGLRAVYSGSGKNSADMMLAIQAVDISHNKSVDTFVIASSDGDYTHLAHYLRENGFRVIGIGEGKTAINFRKACSSFVEIGHKAPAQRPATAPRPNIEPQDNTINQWLAQLISQNDEPNGMEISRIGGTMHTLHKVKISERPEKNWRAYLERQNKFQCDPRGAGARVRIK